jgi:hypothetical protein
LCGCKSISQKTAASKSYLAFQNCNKFGFIITPSCRNSRGNPFLSLLIQYRQWQSVRTRHFSFIMFSNTLE